MKRIDGTIIPNVSVSINGADTIVTDSLGRYGFNVPQGSNYIVMPSKNNDKTLANGVNGTDISLIQSHILKKVILNSPYKLIAADVNNDGSVNGTDIALIKSLVLKHITKFSGNRLWSFIDSSYSFPIPTKPYPFHDSIGITAINSNQSGKNFIGVKLGDVNFDWNAGIQGMGFASTPIELFNDNINLNSNATEVRVPIKVKNFKNIMGMQYTLNFNSDVLELKSVENNGIGADYNMDFAAEGKIPFLWVDDASEARTLADSTVLFELVFNKKGNFISEDISLSSDITSISAFDGNYGSVGIVKSVSKLSDIVDITNNLKVYPNPAKDAITINGNHVREIQVIDNLGNIVKEFSFFDALNPTIILTGLKNGIYHLRVESKDGKVNRTSFVVE